MFRNMSRSLAIPHFLYTDEIAMDACSQLRSEINASILGSSSINKVSYLPIVAKALSLAALEYPLVNASISGDLTDLTSLALVARGPFNLAFALDTPQGLQLPVIQKVGSLSILEIAKQMDHLRELGVQGKLGKSETEGATFALSNIGNIGGGVVMPVGYDFTG